MIVLTAWVVVLCGLLTCSGDAFTPSLSFRGGSTPPPPIGHPSSFNATMGHSDMMWALGIDTPAIYSVDAVARRAAGVQEEEEVDESLFVVSADELSSALEDALEFCRAGKAELVATGWACVAEAELFTLFKRRVPRDSGYAGVGGSICSSSSSSSGSGSSIEYLMVGNIANVTPRNFLHAQVDTSLRPLWDKTLSGMEILRGMVGQPREVRAVLAGGAVAHTGAPGTGTGTGTGAGAGAGAKPQPGIVGLARGHRGAEDTIYYRTMWPWPLKDRDYILARRCRQFDADDALVFVSRSTEENQKPVEDGTIRVNAYWCHSVFLAGRGRRGRAAHNTGTCMGIGTGSNVDWQGQHDEQPPTGGDDAAAAVASEGEATGSSALDEPGLTFVTHFCDDQDMPLPTSIMDMIARVAEKQVPASMMELYGVARRLPRGGGDGGDGGDGGGVTVAPSSPPAARGGLWGSHGP